MKSILNYIASVLFGKSFRTEVLIHAGGDAASLVNNIAGYKRIDERIAILQVHCSERERPLLGNLRNNRKMPITCDCSGKNMCEGEKLFEQKSLSMIEDIREIVEEHDIYYVQCNNIAGRGDSAKLELYIATEMIAQGIVYGAVLQTILPTLKDDPTTIANALDCIQETAKKVENGDIPSWILIQNGRIANNNSGDLKNRDLNIALVEEIILRSFIIQGNPFDVSDYFKYFLKSDSPKYRISTRGYAHKHLNRWHNGTFINEYLTDVTAKAIKENWLGADLSEQCHRAYIVVRADPKFINDNNLTLIQKVAVNLLPRTAVTVAQYPVKGAQTIEIAALFVGIKTNIIQDFIDRLNEVAPKTEQADEESPWNIIDKSFRPETIQLPQVDIQISKTPVIKSHAIVKADVLDSMAIHALSSLEPTARECYGTIYADNDGKIIKYHPVDSEEHTLRDGNSVKFTGEFYEHVRRLSKLYEDIGLRLAGDNHSHPGGIPLQSNADMDFNKNFWKTDRNTCFITATGHGNGSKEWEIRDNEQEASKEIGGRLIKIRAYAGGTNTDKKLKIVLKE